MKAEAHETNDEALETEPLDRDVLEDVVGGRSNGKRTVASLLGLYSSMRGGAGANDQSVTERAALFVSTRSNQRKSSE